MGNPYKSNQCNECGKDKKQGEAFYVSPETLPLTNENASQVAYEKAVCGECYKKKFAETYPGVKCPVE